MSEAPEFTIRIASRLEDIGRLAAAVEAFGAEHQIPDPVVFAFNLALDEVVTNVISYAFTDVQEHPIDIHLQVTDGIMQAEVIDSGQPFNPMDAPAPDLDAPIEERRIGGLGIHIVREMMDSLEYRREGGRNILVLTKRATSPT
jgi:serine/threonine-protein kinase RsbW